MTIWADNLTDNLIILSIPLLCIVVGVLVWLYESGIKKLPNYNRILAERAKQEAQENAVMWWLIKFAAAVFVALAIANAISNFSIPVRIIQQ